MSSKGGYQILDLKGVALTSGTGSTIAGTFVSIANSHNKRIVVSGLKIGTTVYNDFEASFLPGESGYAASLTIGTNTIDIVVSDADLVTVTATPLT